MIGDEGDTQRRLMDSLTIAYVLANDSADQRRSNFKHHVMIVLILALVGWTAILIFSAGDFRDEMAFLMSLGLGTVLLMALAGVVLVLLRRWTQRAADADLRWAERFLEASRLEGTKVRETDTSTVVLLLDACHEMPRWLKSRSRGVWDRKPWKALVIMFLLIGGINGLFSYNGGALTWGESASVIVIILGVILVFHEERRQRAETRKTREDWDVRMSELESLLLGGER
jgi:uncharacterized membrane protein